MNLKCGISKSKVHICKLKGQNEQRYTALTNEILIYKLKYLGLNFLRNKYTVQ